MLLSIARGGVARCNESFDTAAPENIETVRSFKAPSDGENLSPAPGSRNAQMRALGKFTKSSAVEEVAAVEERPFGGGGRGSDGGAR